MLRFGIYPALIAALFVAGNARAQGIVNPAGQVYAAATPDDIPGEVSNDVANLPPKIVDRLPIEIDDATLAKALGAELPLKNSTTKSLRRPDSAPYAAKWKRIDNRDGSANYSVNKPLAAPWDARIGADLATAAPSPELYEPRPLPGTASSSGSGSAWANVAVPHVAIVEVRAEPADGYDKFGTRIERLVPVGKSFSVKAQSSLGVTEMRPSATPAPDAATRLFSTDNSLELNILATGTTLAAGASSLTGDPVTHNRLSAGQKVYGPLNVTGSIYDPGQPTSNMSITAGMNVTW